MSTELTSVGPLRTLPSVWKGAPMADLASIMNASSAEMTNSLTKIQAALDHNLSKGEAAEETVRRFLAQHLPGSIGVASGQIVDSTGAMSKQLDVTLYDVARTPVLFTSDQGSHRLIPSEGALAVIEVKTHIDASDAASIVKNMLSVKTLDKSAYFAQGMIEQSMMVHGIEQDHFPTLYFVLTFDSGALDGLATGFATSMTSLPVDSRVDMVCILPKGVLLNVLADGTFDGVPQPGSALGSYESQNALLLWYLLLTRFVLQAWTRPINLLKYIPDTFAY